MYKLTEELFNFLLYHTHNLGFIDNPYRIFNLNGEFVLEQDYWKRWHTPEVEGFWLWREYDFSFARTLVSKVVPENGKKMLERILAVRIKTPCVAHKLYEATSISSLVELFEKEPGILKHLDSYALRILHNNPIRNS